MLTENDMAASKTALIAGFLLLLAISSAGCSAATFAAPANPTISTEQPLYTRSNKEAYLKGTRFAAGTYYVWMNRPDQNSTRYTGISFQTAADGSVPSETKIPLGVDYPLGTYRVSISGAMSSDSSLAQCHFGLWGTDKSVYQRTETVGIHGGGIWPGSSVKLIVRNPLGTFVFNSTVAADMNGTFLTKWRVPNSAATESYGIFLDGTGTFDDSSQEYFHKTGFTVTPATLLISIYAKPQAAYQRTESATMDFLVRYPDMSPVISIGGDGVPAILMNGPIVVTRIAPTLVDSVNGVWRAAWKIPVNASLGSDYRFELNAQTFDDGFKNIGGSDKLTSDAFNIIPATLTIAIHTNQSSYQVVFDSIKIRSLITYPSGESLTKGQVSLRLVHNTLNETVPMTYSNATGFWYATRSLSLLELSQIGTWTLSIMAYDGLGNSGAASLEVNVQPWFFVLAIACLIAVAFFLVRGLQWFRRKYWKKFLSGTRSLHTPFRKPETSY